jgi:hypothetical protein
LHSGVSSTNVWQDGFSQHEGSQCLFQIKALKEGSDDVRAVDGDHPVDADKVQSYLKRAFGPRLGDAENVLKVSGLKQ